MRASKRRLRGVSPFSDRVIVMRYFSLDAAEEFADGSLDWVYLDARHDEKSVAEDIRLWYPKVKSGGIFSGHDWIPDGHLYACK